MIFRALKNRNVQRMLALLIVRLVKRRFRRS